MADWFVPALVLGTTLLAVVLGRAALGLPLASLGSAAGETLEAFAFMALFAVANFVLGPAVLLLARLLSGQFVSLYYADDAVLLICSCLQGLVVHRWWASRRTSPRH